jgi:ketosteroid isomerase-like protein
MNETVGNTKWEQITAHYAPSVDATALANRQALIDAYKALPDYAPYWALLDPDVTFHEAPCLPYGGSHSGLEAVQRAFAQVAETFSENHVEHHEVLTAGEYCVAYMTCSWRVAANGNRCMQPVTEILRFRNGKIIDWRVNYFDAAMVAKAIAG